MRFSLFFMLVLDTFNSIAQTDLTALNAFKFVDITLSKYEESDWKAKENSQAIDLVKLKLQSLGFQTSIEDSLVNKQIEENNCLSVRCKMAFIPHGSYTSVYFLFQNCIGDVVYSYNLDVSGGASDEDNLVKATRKFMRKLDGYYYSFNPYSTPKLPEVELTKWNENSIREYMHSKEYVQRNNIEGIYKSFEVENTLELRVGIVRDDDNWYWKTGEVLAELEATTLLNVFTAKWRGVYKKREDCMVKFENSAILSVELKESNLKFIKVFPSAEDIQSPKKTEGISATGSGFALSKDGLLATNAHVVQNSKKIEVVFTSDSSTLIFSAKILLLDKNNDVALLSISDDKFKGFNSIPYGISEKAAIGSDAYTIGFPLNNVMGTAYKVTNGIVSSTSGINDDPRYYQITVPLQPGNSGGPLFDKNGNIIGITSAKLNEKAVGTSVENVNYAIKSAYLSNLCNMLPESLDLSPKVELQGKSLEEQIKVLKNYVCLIKVN
jgi:S1-C subfamily serine protease